MMTTLGATISKTFAKALFKAWTTSLPCSAASAGTVGVGAASGVAAEIGTMAAAISEVKMVMTRIGSNFDSIARATFNWRFTNTC